MAVLKRAAICLTLSAAAVPMAHLFVGVVVLLAASHVDDFDVLGLTTALTAISIAATSIGVADCDSDGSRKSGVPSLREPVSTICAMAAPRTCAAATGDSVRLLLRFEFELQIDSETVIELLDTKLAISSSCGAINFVKGEDIAGLLSIGRRNRVWVRAGDFTTGEA